MKKRRKAKEIVCVNESIKKGRVTDEEVIEFVKTIKHSEYLVVEQLKRMYAHISILSLLHSSGEHTMSL